MTYTLNIYLRFAIMAVSLILGIGLTIAYGFWYAFPFYLVFVVLLVGYILLGTIQSAAQIMQDGDFLAAKKRLGLTLSPKLLYVSNRAYYYLIMGGAELNTGNTEKAEQLFTAAEALELPTDDEKAMVQIQLAAIHASKNRINKAKMCMKNAKKLKIKSQDLKDQLKQLEQSLGARPKMGMHRQGMMQQGGKRRRPKMR